MFVAIKPPLIDLTLGSQTGEYCMSNDDGFYPDQFLEDENQTESEDDLLSLADDAIRQAVVTATDWTTETILTQISKGNILLNPRFQRRDAWNKKRKSKFIESLVLGLPVPQLVLAESKDSRGKYLVLDGKQRLLSIRQFASSCDDPAFLELKLSGLEVRKDLNGKSLKNFQSELELYDDLAAFENQPIRTVIIKNWPNEVFLYHVFLRLNTGSVSLSPQELRQALHPGRFVDFIDESSRESPALRNILNNDKPDFRMRDAELLVRFFAFSYFLNTYSGNLKSFLDTTCMTLNKQWDTEEGNIKRLLAEFENAHTAIRSIFREDAYRKWTTNGFEKRFNRAIFDIMMFAFRWPHVREVLHTHNDKVVSIFIDLCSNKPDFLSSIEQTTKSLSSTHSRLFLWAERLNSEFGTDLHVPQLVNRS